MPLSFNMILFLLSFSCLFIEISLLIHQSLASVELARDELDLECTDSVCDSPEMIASKILFQELNALQNSENCVPNQRLLYFRWWNGGMGAEIHALSLALTLAYMSNRTLVTQSPGWVYTDDSCERGDESCYLEPLSACALSDDEANQLPEWANFLEADAGALLANSSVDDKVALLFHPDVVPNPFAMRLALPQKYRRFGLEWWRSQLVSYIVQPLPWLQEQVDRKWNSLAIPLSAASDDESTVVRVRSGTRRSMASADCTAIHVRRGDKKREDVDQPPLEQFLSEAKKFGRRHLVLASDDELMLNEAAASFDDADFQLHVLTHDHYAKRQVEGYNQQLLNEEMYNRTSVAVDSLRDAMLLGRCSAFVGTMSSNFGRLVHELQVVQLGSTKAAEFKSLSRIKPWYVFP